MAEETARAAQEVHDWSRELLSDLMTYIKRTHHTYTRGDRALTALLEKVCSVHGKNHPELLEIRETFVASAQELTTHLMKEEMVLHRPPDSSP